MTVMLIRHLNPLFLFFSYFSCHLYQLTPLLYLVVLHFLQIPLHNPSSAAHVDLFLFFLCGIELNINNEAKWHIQ